MLVEGPERLEENHFDAQARTAQSQDCVGSYDNDEGLTRSCNTHI